MVKPEEVDDLDGAGAGPRHRQAGRGGAAVPGPDQDHGGAGDPGGRVRQVSALVDCLAMSRPVPDPHLRVPDERARLRAHRRPARGRRLRADGGGRRRRGRGAQHLRRPRERRQPAVRPRSATSSRSRNATRACGSSWPGAWPRRTRADPAQGAVGRRGRRDARAPRAPRPDRDEPSARARRWTSASTRRTFPSALPAVRGSRAPRVGERQRRGATTTARSASCRWSGGRSGRGPSATSWPRCRASPGAGRRGGHAPRPEREHVRPRPDRAGVEPAVAVRRAAPGGGRRRRASGASGSPARIRTTSPPTSSRPWPSARPCASTSTSRCSRARTACSGAMRRSYRSDRYLSWLAADPRGGARDRGHHRRHRGVPRRDRGGLRGDARRGRGGAVRRAFTFQYSPRPGTAAAHLDRPGPEGGRPGAVRPAGRAAGAHLAASGIASGGPDRRGPGRGHRPQGRPPGPDPDEQDGPLRRATLPPGRVPRRGGRARAPAPPERARGRAAPAARRAADRRRREPRAPCWRWSGPTASGKTEASLTVAERARRRDPVGRLDARVPRHGRRDRQADAAERAAVPHHLLDVADAGGAVLACRRSSGWPARRSRRSGGAGAGRCWWRLGAVLPGGGRRAGVPGDRRRRRGEALEREAEALGPDAPVRRLAALDPGAAAEIEPGERPPDRSRPGGRGGDRAAVLEPSPRTWERYPPEAVRAAGGDGRPRASCARASSARVRGDGRRGLLDEVRALLDAGRGPSSLRGQAIGYAEVIEHLAGRLSLDEARRPDRQADEGAGPAAAGLVPPRSPRIRWFAAGARRRGRHRGRADGVPGEGELSFG